MEMNNRQWFKLFRKFLIENNCLDSFIGNVENKGVTSSEEEFLSGQFTFKHTKEGHKYWYELHTKWLRLCRKIKKEQNVRSN